MEEQEQASSQHGGGRAGRYTGGVAGNNKPEGPPSRIQRIFQNQIKSKTMENEILKTQFGEIIISQTSDKKKVTVSIAFSPHEDKPSPALFLREKINGMTIRFEPESESIFFDKDEKTLFEYDKRNKIIWVSCSHIWSILSDQYKMEYKDIQEFITREVVEALNLMHVTPYWRLNL